MSEFQRNAEVLTINLKKGIIIENKKWSVLECQSVHMT